MEGMILQGWTESSKIAESTKTGLTPSVSIQMGSWDWWEGGNWAFEASGMRNSGGEGRSLDGKGGSSRDWRSN